MWMVDGGVRIRDPCLCFGLSLAAETELGAEVCDAVTGGGGRDHLVAGVTGRRGGLVAVGCG